MKLSSQEINELLRKYVMDSLRDFDERYNYQQPPFAYEGGLQHYIRYLDTVKDDLIENLGYADCSMVADTAFELLESHGCKDIKIDSIHFKRLCRELLKTVIQLVSIEKRHLQGDFSYLNELPNLFPVVFSKESSSVAIDDNKTSEPLSQVIQDFWKEKEPTWKPRTKAEVKRTLDHLRNYLGPDTPVHTIDGPTMRKYKQDLLEEEYKRGKTRSITNKELMFCEAKTLIPYSLNQ